MLDLQKISAAIDQVAAERKLKRETLVDVVESAIRTAYKKDYGSKDEVVNVKLDFAHNKFEISLEKTVVDVVEDETIQISVEDAGGEEAGVKVGDVIEIDVTEEVMAPGSEFGRIASQAARQVIIQKLQESEKAKIFDLFRDKEGTIVSTKVELVEKNKVFLDYNGTSVLLPRGEQVNRDDYQPGKRLTVYVAKVDADALGEGPQVVLSRRNTNLVVKLFEANTPELEEGTVEIVKIVRIPGFKTKLIVGSEYDEVDPAGCLIGPKGTRVKAVVEELGGEKIDVINYTDNQKELIAAALGPAQVLDVKLDNEARTAVATLTKEEELRAIGRSGWNVRLAEELTGWKISLKASDEGAAPAAPAAA
jgi:N utilization substance protein A